MNTIMNYLLDSGIAGSYNFFAVFTSIRQWNCRVPGILDYKIHILRTLLWQMAVLCNLLLMSRYPCESAVSQHGALITSDGAALWQRPTTFWSKGITDLCHQLCHGARTEPACRCSIPRQWAKDSKIAAYVKQTEHRRVTESMFPTQQQNTNGASNKEHNRVTPREGKSESELIPCLVIALCQLCRLPRTRQEAGGGRNKDHNENNDADERHDALCCANRFSCAPCWFWLEEMQITTAI